MLFKRNIPEKTIDRKEHYLLNVEYESTFKLKCECSRWEKDLLEAEKNLTLSIRYVNRYLERFPSHLKCIRLIKENYRGNLTKALNNPSYNVPKFLIQSGISINPGNIFRDLAGNYVMVAIENYFYEDLKEIIIHRIELENQAEK